MNRWLPIAGLVVLLTIIPEGKAQETCETGARIHNYPVERADVYVALFSTVESYRLGPAGRRPWPFAADQDTTYPTRDFCPLDADDRMVRLFDVSAEAGAMEKFQPGTLTLTTRDLDSAREVARRLADEPPRDSEIGGRKGLYLTDTAGNDVFIWEYPGPPEP